MLKSQNFENYPNQPKLSPVPPPLKSDSITVGSIINSSVFVDQNYINTNTNTNPISYTIKRETTSITVNQNSGPSTIQEDTK
jgi:hypothetical protein